MSHHSQTSIEPAYAALEALYRANHARLVTVIDSRISDLHSAQDLASRVFELALEHLLEGVDVTIAWLYTCARNLVGSEYQRRTRAGRDHLALIVDRAIDGPEEQIARSDALARALLVLSPLDQDIVKLHYWHSMPTRDIAAMVELSYSAVRMRLSRAYDTLGDVLTPTFREVSA